MYLRGWYSYRRSRQEVVQFIWNACGVKKNSLLSSVGKQDITVCLTSTFYYQWLCYSVDDETYHIYSKTQGGFIKFFMIRVQRLFLSGIFTKGSVYLKSNLFLANNSMVTDQGKQKYYRSCYWLSSWFLLKELKIKSYLQCSLLGAKSNLHWKSSKVCIITKSPLASLLLKV